MSAQPHRCREDLFARSRRAPLSAVERRALDAHLAVCDLCRAAGAFAAVYDAVPDDASADDDLLVARLAERVASRAVAVRPRPRAKMVAGAAGLALLVAAGGAAAWVSVHGFPSRSVETRAVAPPESRGPRTEAAPVARPLDETAERAAPALQEPDGQRRAPVERAITRHGGGDRGKSARMSLAAAAPAAPTAAELFAEANAARRALDLRRATDLYLALDRRFPGSAEAPVALVSAGDLLSRLGQPSAALEAFDRYLERRPDGALAPEALFGRARTFRQLARRQDEIDAWRRLLRAFPGSVYESAGRQRLGELLR
jgi:tetratricopeptide (TPR) repeat protein